MTIQEVRECLKSEGWTYLPRLRKGRSYIYAQRKVHGKKIERYICALAALAEKTINDILEKLNCSAAKRLAHSDKPNDQAYTEQNQPIEAYMPALSIIPAIITQQKRKEA